MIRGPSAYLTADADSGRTIRLTGNVLWWSGGTPAGAMGDYKVHAASLKRGAEVRRESVGGRAWNVATWKVWCWRRGHADALRIYLKLVDLCEHDQGLRHGDAFPSAIDFAGGLWPHDPLTVSVTLTSTSAVNSGEVIFVLPQTFAWNLPYCRVTYAVERIAVACDSRPTDAACQSPAAGSEAAPAVAPVQPQAESEAPAPAHETSRFDVEEVETIRGPWHDFEEDLLHRQQVSAVTERTEAEEGKRREKDLAGHLAAKIIREADLEATVKTLCGMVSPPHHPAPTHAGTTIPDGNDGNRTGASPSETPDPEALAPVVPEAGTGLDAEPSPTPVCDVSQLHLRIDRDKCTISRQTGGRCNQLGSVEIKGSFLVDGRSGKPTVKARILACLSENPNDGVTLETWNCSSFHIECTCGQGQKGNTSPRALKTAMHELRCGLSDLVGRATEIEHLPFTAGQLLPNVLRRAPYRLACTVELADEFRRWLKEPSSKP